MPTDDVGTAEAGLAQAGAQPGGTRAPESANMSAQAYRAISNKIKSRELRGGDTLVEQRLAAQLGVSRTPCAKPCSALKARGCC